MMGKVAIVEVTSKDQNTPNIIMLEVTTDPESLPITINESSDDLPESINELVKTLIAEVRKVNYGSK